MSSHPHLARPDLDQSVEKSLYMVAGEVVNNFLPESIGKPAAFSYKHKSERLNNTASLLREHIYVFIVTFIHIAQIYGVR